jgi:uncharacterized linocin/CFP29 family protein
MNHLRRALSPVLPAAFEIIEARAREVLVAYLAGRKLVDFEGPLGFDTAVVPLGRVRALSSPAGTEARLRLHQPLVELRVPFDLPLSELDNVARGADDLDVEPVAEAARQLALLEDGAIFSGMPEAQIGGMAPSSAHEPIKLPSDFREFPGLVSEAIARLHAAGVAGPYAIALDTESYTALQRTTGTGGYPILQHVRKLAEGPTVFAPALKGALVVSMRGGDFKLTIGQDAAIGYLSHDHSIVHLYIEETMTFRVLGPEACVALPRA